MSRISASTKQANRNVVYLKTTSPKLCLGDVFTAVESNLCAMRMLCMILEITLPGREQTLAINRRAIPNDQYIIFAIFASHSFTTSFGNGAYNRSFA